MRLGEGMTDFLVKHFIKDYENVEAQQVRTHYGMLASAVGIICNVFLFLAKLAVGMVLNSIAVMADAFNNLSDAASSVIGLVGVRMASKPADADHPFGHGRIEYISAFIVAFLVLQVGFSLFKTSVGKIVHPETLHFSLVSVVILVLSVLVKLWMGMFNKNLGNRINSAVMKATAADSLGDVASTSATIGSIMVFGIFGWNIDGFVGLIVSVVVMVAGFGIAKETLAPLIGEAVPVELYKRISDFVQSYDGVEGCHDLIVHNYGPSKSLASIHAEVPRDVDIEVSHEIIDRIERDAAAMLGIFLVVHMDPIETKDTTVEMFRQMVIAVLQEMDGRLTMHDFRMVDGEKNINLIFDVVVPHEYPVKEHEKIREEICSRVRQKDPRCSCVITVDISFCAQE